MAIRPGSSGARAFVVLQYLLPQHALSHLVHRLARVRTAYLKNALIRAFVRRFRPAMHEAVRSDPLAYGSFNEFFTRELAAGSRTIAADPLVASPVDGTVSQAGLLDGERLVQAKGRRYALPALLADAFWAQVFRGGAFATLYLAPRDYHRVHMPLAGTLRGAWYVPGRLFSVNPATTAAVDGLFARNERVVCVFDGPAGPFAVVLVGALFVGSVATVWHGEIARGPVRRSLHPPLAAPHRDAGMASPPDRAPPPDCAHLAGAVPLSPLPGTPAALAKGAQLGWFNMGSTVILLFPPGRIEWQPALLPGAPVVVGRALARLVSGPGN